MTTTILNLDHERRFLTSSVDTLETLLLVARASWRAGALIESVRFEVRRLARELASIHCPVDDQTIAVIEKSQEGARRMAGSAAVNTVLRWLLRRLFYELETLRLLVLEHNADFEAPVGPPLSLPGEIVRGLSARQ